MEVSNEIKEDIRKTQTELKNAIRIHQVWVARLQEDENNAHLKLKVKEAEKDIIVIGQTQKRVVDRLRRELELYQQRLKARNKIVNIENDNKYVAQQLRDHQIQYKNKNRPVSLLKSSVLTEIHIETENGTDDKPPSVDGSDSENEVHFRDNCVDSDKQSKNCTQFSSVHNSRNNFVNALNKVKETLNNTNPQDTEWGSRSPECESPGLSPTPSPPPLPASGEPITQEIFLRCLGLVTHRQKEIIQKKRNERRKRSTTSTNRNEFVYGNFDMVPKRKKYNQFPYLQSHNGPPQTRSAKLRKQQKQNDQSSREESPSGSSSDNKGGWSSCSSKPAWAASLPAGLSVEPVYSKKACHGCGRNDTTARSEGSFPSRRTSKKLEDVTSLLVRCEPCGMHWHTGCGERGRCSNCRAPLPDPAHCTTASSPPDTTELFRDKLKERKRLQEKNIELCLELRKLEARASTLKENLDDHHAERRQLLADQIKTQRNLQKLLNFIRQFKDTSVSMHSTSVSDGSSEVSKSNDE